MVASVALKGIGYKRYKKTKLPTQYPRAPECFFIGHETSFLMLMCEMKTLSKLRGIGHPKKPKRVSVLYNKSASSARPACVVSYLFYSITVE
jgi:hypothetical protein